MTDQDNLLWSPSTHGFYLPDISSQIPEDAVPVDASVHANCMAQLAAGGVLSCCPETSAPIAAAPVIAPTERRAALVRAIKAEAYRRIGLVSPIWRQLNDLRMPNDEGSVRFSAIDAIRAASGAIEELVAAAEDDALPGFPVATNPLWPVFGDA
jgi:hypothetical protein